MTKPAIVDDYYSHINTSEDKTSLSNNSSNAPKIKVKIKNIKEEVVKKEELTEKKETTNFKKEETIKKASVKSFVKNEQRAILEPVSKEAPKKSLFIKKEDVVAKQAESPKKFTPK
jgi:hypothetical protein